MKMCANQRHVNINNRAKEAKTNNEKIAANNRIKIQFYCTSTFIALHSRPTLADLERDESPVQFQMIARVC